ncbi:hypothetical protein RIVM261_081820 [Rivularia sp. IAM M-261]|nr:hypothetical protein CAL7716_098250 [Calothrix sp. PCC 7716]GJD23226.1 hypothetical protein RIVM261_081820 [Rivularia sp. IAM M-261]
MIISDLKVLEVVEANEVVGGTFFVSGNRFSSTYNQNDNVAITFTSNNNFNTKVNTPLTGSNSAAAGAKGDAINNTHIPTYSFTKADTLAVTEYLGGSFSGSTSAAVINFIGR